MQLGEVFIMSTSTVRTTLITCVHGWESLAHSIFSMMRSQPYSPRSRTRLTRKEEGNYRGELAGNGWMGMRDWVAEGLS
jgi:hypothetical protein